MSGEKLQPNPHPSLFPIWSDGRIGVVIWAPGTPLDEIQEDLSHSHPEGGMTAITFGSPEEIAAEFAAWERPPLIVDMTNIPALDLRRLTRAFARAGLPEALTLNVSGK